MAENIVITTWMQRVEREFFPDSERAVGIDGNVGVKARDRDSL
jgi:hypothetical protein